MTDEAAEKKRRVRLERRPEAITYAVDDLLLAVRDGVVRVPHFQRGMRWDAGDRVALFDSLLRGFPIGTLLFWRRKGPEETLHLGDLEIHASARDDARYVFDGQQRITTLAQAAFITPSTGDRVLHYDLAAERFVWERTPGPEEAPLSPRLVPVRALLDTSHLTEWIIARASELTASDRAAAIDAGKRLREYRIPAYLVDTGEESTLREIFERVNRSGRKLTDAEVFHALYVVSTRSDDGIASVQHAARDLAWGSLDENVALNVLRAVEGLPVRQALSATLDGARMQRAVPRAKDAAHRAAAFLQSRCAIPHNRLAPYILPMVTLARFFDAFPEPSERTRTLLRRWLWRGLAGLHLTGATVDLRRHLKTVVHGAEDDSAQRLLALAPSAADPSVFDTVAPDIRTARTKVQTCALVARTPRDLRTSAAVDVAAIAAPDASPLVKVVSDDAPNELAGRIFHAALPRRELVRLLSQADAATLASHLIDAPALHALTTGDEEGFVSLRREAVVSWLRTFTARMAEWGADDSPPIASLAAEDDD